MDVVLKHSCISIETLYFGKVNERVWFLHFMDGEPMKKVSWFITSKVSGFKMAIFVSKTIFVVKQMQTRNNTGSWQSSVKSVQVLEIWRNVQTGRKIQKV